VQPLSGDRSEFCIERTEWSTDEDVVTPILDRPPRDETALPVGVLAGDRRLLQEYEERDAEPVTRATERLVLVVVDVRTDEAVQVPIGDAPTERSLERRLRLTEGIGRQGAGRTDVPLLQPFVLSEAHRGELPRTRDAHDVDLWSETVDRIEIETKDGAIRRQEVDATRQRSTADEGRELERMTFGSEAMKHAGPPE
jgi:hypothetical protein